MTEKPEQVADNLRHILEQVCEYSKPCKACGIQLWFVRLKSGRVAPYTHEGVNHFVDCPSAKDFKKRKQAEVNA